jgi:hypothetical protein
MSLQWSNNWEPNIFNKQHNTPSCLYWHNRRFWVQNLEWPCPLYLHFLPTASATAWFISFIYDLHESSVSSSLGHGVPAAVYLSLRHTTFILLTKTKVYGYNCIWAIHHLAIIVCLQQWSGIVASTNLEIVASLWQFVTVCDSLWQSDSLRQFVTVCDSLWQFVTIDDNKTEDESSSQDTINVSVVAGIIWISREITVQLNVK